MPELHDYHCLDCGHEWEDPWVGGPENCPECNSRMIGSEQQD